MSEIESQIADLEAYVNKRTRYSERVRLPTSKLIILLCVLAPGVQGFFTVHRMFEDHKSNLDETVKTVFYEAGLSRSGASDDTVTVQRGNLTRVLEDHVTIDYPVAVIFILLGVFYVSAIGAFFVRRRATRHLVQAMRIITQLQGQSVTTETT